ncbi:mitochondrial inner membrane protease subunit 2 isoform X4 [Chrysemys picta bellii]|uniref:mitochondrial inner membrane protease subunit 2 isoform X4 n=1 Tax=Chrysemys picta bellii TaxID=8478 RepID=UPI0032B16832
MAQAQGFGRKYIKAFFKGFFVAVPVTVTFLDRVACVARVEGASMQPSLNPGERQVSDVVLLNHWSIRNYEVQRGDIVSLVSPKNPEQKIIKRVIALEGDIVKTIGYKNKYVKVPHGHIWVEGDHHGHSFDSNAFGPNSLRLFAELVAAGIAMYYNRLRGYPGTPHKEIRRQQISRIGLEVEGNKKMK